MKILLTAINAKYIHSNLAVYSLRAYAREYASNIEIKELTINQQEEDILREIYKEKADVVAFSCYIWNIDIIKRICTELRKVQPSIKIWLGGPEVSYDARQFLKANQAPDGIMVGEGEQTFLELVRYYAEDTGSLDKIQGIVYKESAGKETSCEVIIHKTPQRELLSLDDIPFPYENINDFTNRIIYYESSRGCPFACSYCLSSIDKSVRLRSVELVTKELKVLLDAKVPQVKFVDRTFNCNKIHAMAIWKFIKENDNLITNFHFEISADLLTDEEIEFLSHLRPGQVQLEIGVQSTNPDTIKAIHRKMDLDKLRTNVEKIRNGRNIHQHLDLIAGLPLEDYKSFMKSFHEVYLMKPDQLQLGFLKVLKGSKMETERENYGIIYRNNAPYEVLYTKYLDYADLLRIKGICDMVEVYYNSAQFTNSISFLEHFYESPFHLYEDLSDYYEEHELTVLAHSRMKRYEILLDFYTEILLKKPRYYENRYQENNYQENNYKENHTQEMQYNDKQELDKQDTVRLDQVKQNQVKQDQVKQDQVKQDQDIQDQDIQNQDNQELLEVFKELLLLDLYLRENLKSRPPFAPIRQNKGSFREISEKYQKDHRMIHIEQFDYNVTLCAQTAIPEKAETILLFDYSNRDPLSNAATVTKVTI